MSNTGDSFMNPIPRKSSLVEDVIRELSNYILEGLLENRISVGDRLPSERELSDNLKVGRSTLREAVRVLTLLGLLEVRPGQGTFIADGSTDFYAAPLAWGLIIGEKSVKELVEARALLDMEAAYLAATRATHEELSGIVAVFNSMTRHATIQDVKEFIEDDVQFHMNVAKAAHNTVIFQTLRTIRRLLELWIGKALSNQQAIEDTLSEHKEILQCILRRDPEGAKRAMGEHVASATSRFDPELKN